VLWIFGDMMALSLRPSSANPSFGVREPEPRKLRALLIATANSTVATPPGAVLVVKDTIAKFVPKRRLKPYHLAACVLFVGWAPSLLLAYYSYSVLSPALEAKIMADAQSLVGSISQHVENELERTGETMDYYRTLPITASVLQPATPASPTAPPSTAAWAASARRPHGPPVSAAAGPGPLSPQDWLATIFYPQKRIDGMFLTDAQGELVASLPHGSGRDAHEFSASPWKEATEQDGAGFHVSPIYPRAADGRLVTSVVVAIREKARGIVGFLGADILVERLGRRLRAIEFVASQETMIQIIDQDGDPLFTGTLDPEPAGAPAFDAGLLREFRARKSGVIESGGRLYVFAPIAPTSWIAVLEKPALLAHKPVHDLLGQTLLLVGWLVVGTAITAYVLSRFYRHQLQNSLSLEQGQIFNEKILANMPVGIALIDPSGENFLTVNEAFIEIVRALGSLPGDEDLSRAPFSRVAIASPEALARVLHFGVPYQAIDQRTPTAAGPVRYLTTNLLRLQDSHQRTLGVLCLVEDSTAAVTLRQELMSASAAKDRFLAQLSHELRNPLSPVITMVAELEALAEAQPAARVPLEIIRRNVELEARLIDDLLDVTRISSGKLQLNRQPVDVHRILRLALEICQQEIEAKQLRVCLDLSAGEHHANADPARLQQVYWNLLKNAVKFSAQGRHITVRSLNVPVAASHTQSTNGVSAAPAATNGSREVSAAGSDPAASTIFADGARGDILRIEIIDEGIGIEAQHLSHIFNAFDQGETSITQRFGGLGLGLAISKAMIQAHGGRLSAASAGLGKGATFTTDLAVCAAPAGEGAVPAVQADPGVKPRTAQPSAGTAPANTSPATGTGHRVLLVDDHQDTCLGMRRLLDRRGYRVSIAHSVAEALAQARENAFDLLISDLGLPDGTGFDLMEELRRRGGPPGIALSGYGMEGDVAKSREAGFSEHLIKPVAIDRLEAAMRHLLGNGG
jgi:signal transduction histidine kinase